MSSIFLSHSHKDKLFARKLSDRLKEHGIYTWLDEAEMHVGDSLITKIGEAIRECRYLGVVISQHSASSEWVRREVNIALTDEIQGRRIKVLPLLCEKCELPAFLADKIYADFTNDFDEGLERLLARFMADINAGQKEPKTFTGTKASPKRVNKLIWIGIAVAILATIIGIIYINRNPAIRPPQTDVNTNPPNAEAYLKKGEDCEAKRDYDCSLENYTKAIELNSRYAEAYNYRGSVYGLRGNIDLAINDFTKAIEANPRYAEAYYNRGIAYGRNSNYDLAISDFNKAIESNPQLTEAYNDRGTAYERTNASDLAMKDYTKAIEIDPQYAGAYYNRGTLYGRNGNYDQAIIDLSRAIELDPEYADAYYNRRIAYEKTGQLAKAIADRRTYNQLLANITGQPKTAQPTRYNRNQSNKGRHSNEKLIILDERTSNSKAPKD
jgi:tetratricopeptide (TPR) repeat protein